jgi:hypothetical protein
MIDVSVHAMVAAEQLPGPQRKIFVDRVNYRL